MAFACALVFAQQESTPKKPDPPILIGPSRVTLVGGKTIEAIAVFRETGRVRVVLEDDTEIDFDPAKVVSVVALADLPDVPPPAAKSAAKAPAPPGKKGSKAAAAPVKVHAEPAANGKTTSTRNGSSNAGASGAADGGSAAAGTADDAAARAKEEREREVDELAGMLQAAIANAAFEGGRIGGPDDGASSEAGEAGEKAGKGATGAPSADADGSSEAQTDTEKKVYKPRPEDFDATRPVNKAGFRFLGPPGKYPETPPQLDFPKPSAPVTSMGFGADTWRPNSGFSSTAKWGTLLAPATSFPNRLSGLGPPITSFGPSWWGPTPAIWPNSIFPQYWQPKDGFAQSEEMRNPPPPPAKSTPEQSK